MKGNLEKIRIDKWLWAVRLFKSRSMAAENCDKGKIRIAGQPVKASRNIKAGEVITIRRGAFTLQFEVLQLTENRLPAKSATDFCKDITSHEEKEKIKIHSLESIANRQQGGEDRPKETEETWMNLFSSDEVHSGEALSSL